MTLVNDNQQAGFHRVVWNGTNDRGIRVTSGMYLYRIQVNGSTNIKRLLLIKQERVVMKNYVYTLLNMTPLGALALIVGSIDFVFTQPSSPPVAPAAPISLGLSIPRYRNYFRIWRIQIKKTAIVNFSIYLQLHFHFLQFLISFKLI